MKKYLIKGALALFSGGLLFSCAEKESEYVPIAQQKVKAFEDVFKEVFGDDIDPYQDWGFSQGKTNADELPVVDVVDLSGDVAFTRAGAFGSYGALMAFAGTRAGGDFANYVGAYPNANQWTHNGFQAPDPLTPGQKLRVQYYFQTVKITSPNQPNNGVKDFFMQQVYDGATDPITKYKQGNYSTEMYVDGDGNTFDSGTIMNYLKAGSDHQHVNNFNNSDFPNPTQHVANWNQTILDDPDQEHEDQIMLMLNTKTDCFGYLDSNNNTFYDDQWTLVAGSVIDNYCDHIDPTGYQAFLRAHNGVTDKAVDDKWHRSFIGFDFKLMPETNPFIEGEYAMYSDAGDQTQGSYVYKTDGTIITIDNKNTQILINNKPIPVLTDNMNFYGANVVGVGGERNHNEYAKIKDFNNDYQAGQTKDDCLYLQNHTDGVQSDHYALNLKFIANRIAEGYYPVHGTQLRLWAKPNDQTDGFYSDWIVSFMPSSYQPQSDKYIRHDEDTWHAIDRGRVFCEDLGRAAREDLDYNDIVFDAIVFKKNTKHYETHEVWDKDPDKNSDAKRLSSTTTEYEPESETFYLNIELLAAGGTIPVSLKVGNDEYVIHDQFNEPEPTPTDMMVNTRDNNSTAYGSFGTREYVQLGDIHKSFSVTFDDGTTEAFVVDLIEVPESLASIDQIKLWSCFNGGMDVAEIDHVKGGAPQKFMAPWGTTKWASERNNISLAYPGKHDANGNIIEPGFNDWVKNSANEPWNYANNDYCYTNAYNPNGRQLPLAFRSYSNVSAEKEQRLWEKQGGEPFGSTWSLANLDLTLDVPQFVAGDRLRFYAENIPTPTNGEKFTNDDQKAWITVVIGNITPYFINTEFPYYAVEKGVRVFKSSGCLEVVIDQASADLINSYISGGKLTFQVQGRNFTLMKISRIIN